MAKRTRLIFIFCFDKNLVVLAMLEYDSIILHMNEHITIRSPIAFGSVTTAHAQMRW